MLMNCGPKFSVTVSLVPVKGKPDEFEERYFPHVDHPDFGLPHSSSSYGEAWEKAWEISKKLQPLVEIS